MGKHIGLSLLIIFLLFFIPWLWAPDAPADTTPDDAGSVEPADDNAEDAAGSTSDLASVQNKGTLVVGITDFAPMDYRAEGSDEWIGFDADMAKLFAES